MIPSPIEQAQNVLDDADIALCQRVYDQIIALKLITTDATREDLVVYPLAEGYISVIQHVLRLLYWRWDHDCPQFPRRAKGRAGRRIFKQD
ncbi:hypothetical protein EHI42_01610 [Rhizobium hidalgonense]|uniref:hypothetical protein n=1 Tax=Rhizobium hidalgonense TaxID=1538159 RepID=UPI000FEC64AC|nr:hypothetical protein [Rhizobium hidalgonense]RWX20136.1 hypothetical protein EHI42_01610 [Rhizobium hidalgonense]